MKGYYIGSAYLGWIPSEGKYIQFPTENEYLEYVDEDEE